MVNYSHIIGEAIVLMWKPSMIESPFGRSPEKAPRWDLTGTEGCGGGKLVPWHSVIDLGYKSIYRQRKYVGGEGPTRVGARLPPGRALLPRSHLVASPTSSPSLLVCFGPRKIIVKVSFHLDFV